MPSLDSARAKPLPAESPFAIGHMSPQICGSAASRLTLSAAAARPPWETVFQQWKHHQNQHTLLAALHTAPASAHLLTHGGAALFPPRRPPRHTLRQRDRRLLCLSVTEPEPWGGKRPTEETSSGAKRLPAGDAYDAASLLLPPTPAPAGNTSRHRQTGTRSVHVWRHLQPAAAAERRYT